MKILSIISIILAIVAWGLMAMMGTNLLSGSLEGRTCGTDCVQIFFISGLGLAIIAAIVSVLSIRSSGGDLLNVIGLLASLAICGIAGVLFIAGNFF